ncbi:MAG: fibronectin type III domain-containing protein [Sarcina sp.]|nr:fibronectin type III domain-containing protein [Sarcina sp.]HAL60678.1 hypothetical protein [Sarcina sp.]
MINSIKRFAAGLLIAVLLVGTFSVTNAEAALPKPGNARFVKWNNSKFTSCRIAWNTVSGADYYEIVWTYTDGSHWNHRYQYNSYNYIDITGLDYNHVYKAQVRSLKMNGDVITDKSSWSNSVYITPWPRSIKGSLKGESDVRLSWNKISGSSGYNVFLATNPNGTWRWNQSTDTTATATSAHVKKYSGSKLKTYQNYYFRIVTRRKQNGSFVSVPTPYDGYYSGRFYLYVSMKYN